MSMGGGTCQSNNAYLYCSDTVNEIAEKGHERINGAASCHWQWLFNLSLDVIQVRGLIIHFSWRRKRWGDDSS